MEECEKVGNHDRPVECYFQILLSLELLQENKERNTEGQLMVIAIKYSFVFFH